MQSKAAQPMRKSLLSFLILLTTMTGLSGPVRAADPVFDPDRIRWSGIEMSASKLLITMDVAMTLEDLSGASAASRLVTPMTARESEHLDRITALRFVTDGLGRRNEVELLMDPGNGAALQRTSIRTGNRPKHRIYRFDDDHILRMTRRPRSGEDNLQPDRWSERSEETYRYPPSAEPGAIAEATSLIYLAATSSIARPGDRVSILALASDEVHLVELIGQKPAEVRVDYFSVNGARTERYTGKTSAIRISIRARSLNPEKGEEFELLGLKDLEVYLDPASRVPLELRGKVDFFGKVEFELKRVTLADKMPSRDPIDRGPEGK